VAERDLGQRASLNGWLDRGGGFDVPQERLAA
jgi:hypothetical protein